MGKISFSKKKLTINELLLKNKDIRYGDAKEDILINKTFNFNNDSFTIIDIQLIPGQTKDMAMLERQSDGQIFQDPDFASTTPFKLNLKNPNESTKNMQKQNKEKR